VAADRPSAAITLPAPRVHVQGTWFRITRVDSEPFLWTDEPADGRWEWAVTVEIDTTGPAGS